MSESDAATLPAQMRTLLETRLAHGATWEALAADLNLQCEGDDPESRLDSAARYAVAEGRITAPWLVRAAGADHEAFACALDIWRQVRPERPQGSGEPMRVLLGFHVDQVGRVMKRAFESTGHRARWVDSGDALVEAWSTEGPFDVIFTEGRLFGRDGLDAVARIRETAAGPVPVLFASSLPSYLHGRIQDPWLYMPFAADTVFDSVQLVASAASPTGRICATRPLTDIAEQLRRLLRARLRRLGDWALLAPELPVVCEHGSPADRLTAATRALLASGEVNLHLLVRFLDASGWSLDQVLKVWRAARTEADRTRFHPRRVLVGATEPILGQATEQALAQDGCTATVVADGPSLVQAWTENGPFDAILTEVQLPELTGPAAVSRIRAHTADPVPVMLMYRSQEDVDPPPEDLVHRIPIPQDDVLDLVKIAIAAAQLSTT